MRRLPKADADSMVRRLIDEHHPGVFQGAAHRLTVVMAGYVPALFKMADRGRADMGFCRKIGLRPVDKATCGPALFWGDHGLNLPKWVNFDSHKRNSLTV